MSRLTNDLHAIRQFMQMGLISLIDVLVLGVSTIVMMLLLDRMLFWYAVVPLIGVTFSLFSLAGIFLFSSRKFKILLALLPSVSKSFLLILECCVLLEKAQSHRYFESVNADYYKYYLREVRLDALFGPITGLFAGISTLLVIWVGIRELQAGRLELGTLVSYVNYIGLLLWPMMAIGFGCRTCNAPMPL